MSKIYFGFRILLIKIKSIILINYYRIFGIRCGKGTTINKKLMISGYLNRIQIGKKCSFHEGIRIVVNRQGKLVVGDNTLISANVNINSGIERINIGSNVMIAANTYIINNDHDIFDNLSVRNSGHISKCITINDNVWIGANCVILKGVNIGEGAIIGAGSIVTKDIIPYSVNHGIPCRFVKYRFTENELIKRLKDEGYKEDKVKNIVEEMYK